MNIKLIIVSAATFSALCGAGDAGAASFIQRKTDKIHFTAFDNTDQNITLMVAPGLVENFKPFDTTLGTLESINVAWTVTVTANVVGSDDTSYISTNEDASYQISSTYEYGKGSLDLYGDATSSPAFGINGGSSNSKLFTLSTPENPAINNVIFGRNPFSAVFNAGAIVLHAYKVSSGSAELSHTTIVTYTYTPAIPEPKIYMSMLAGLGALGFIARQRNTA